MQPAARHHSDDLGDLGDLARAVERATGVEVAAVHPVRGGDVATSSRLELADGRRLFAKTHRDPPPGFFTTEAAGLAWLREARAVDVPLPVSVSDGDGDGPPFLVLEWIARGHPTAATDADLGRALARMHDAGAPCFGREDRRTTGSRRLPNEPRATWHEFYAECRLFPLARMAADADAVDDTTVAALEGVAGRLVDLDDGESPSRLHGDLWAGNRMIDVRGTSWLIDPAAHGGHREFDLAMMRLFGGFGQDCFAAYEEVHPLTPGWGDRVALHQIAPLVVHAIKFGGGYVGAAIEAIGAYA